MKLDENLTAIHAYLCADGYVIKNPEKQKQKYYIIGLRNTNLTLLKDFQDRFEMVFRIKPHLIKGQRCRIGSKEIYKKLTKAFGSFYSWEWKMPELKGKLLRIWLRTYFDCEGWVFCKSHQNRHIGVDSVNEKGLNQVEKSLNEIGIKTIRKFNKKRKIHRIFIYGKNNILLFQKKIGFLHPDKKLKLNKTLEDFMVYEWNFPKNEEDCKKFVLNTLKNKLKINRLYYLRIFSKEQINLTNLSKYLKKFYKVESLINKRVNGRGMVYYELSINKRLEVEKLIKLRVIPNLFKCE